MEKNNQSEASNSLCSEQEQQPKQPKPKKAPHIVHLLNTKINLKKIIINISDTQYSVVSEVAEELEWKVQSKSDAADWDVYWTDSAILPEILFKMHFFQKINHYPGIQIIARKNLLGLNLMAMRQKFPDQYNFFPLTWMLPSQYSQFRQYYQSIKKTKARIFIAKPEADCQGRGIFLTRSIQDLTNGNRYVVQKYLTKPFLIDGLKFDFRIYVLLAGTDPLRIYLYEQGLARFATQQYKQPTLSNMNDMCMHLTNYAINKLNPKFIFNTSQKNMNVGHKRSLTSVFTLLTKMGHNVSLLKVKIKDLIIKTFITGLPLISHQYKYCQPEQYSGNMCFQILGFDIILNHELEPLLLEVNHTPSFTTDTPLDQHIKFNLIKDTLILMNINSKTKTQLFQKAKVCNSERLLTGKRRIFYGPQKDHQIYKVQKQRDEYEEKHMGGFEKIHPTKSEETNKKYLMLIEYSKKIYSEENTLRSRVLKEEKINIKHHQAKNIEVEKNQSKQVAIAMNNFMGKSPNKSNKNICQKIRLQPDNKSVELINSEVIDLAINTPSPSDHFTRKLVVSRDRRMRENIYKKIKTDNKEPEKVIQRQKTTSVFSNLNKRTQYIAGDYKLEREKTISSVGLSSFQSENIKVSKPRLGNFLKPKLYDLSRESQTLKNRSVVLSLKFGNTPQLKKRNYLPLNLKQFINSKYQFL